MNETEFTEFDDSCGVIDINSNTKDISPSIINVNPNTGEFIDRVALTPFEKIKFAAEKFGMRLNDPNKNCKRCSGRGYTGIDSNTKVPVHCQCIIPTAMKNHAAQNFIPTNRKAKRLMDNMKRKGLIKTEIDASNV